MKIRKFLLFLILKLCHLNSLGNIFFKSSKEPMEQMLIPTKISTHFFREALLNEWKHCTSQQSKLSSNYKFDNAYDGIKQSTEFENLISLLADVNYYYLFFLNSINERLIFCLYCLGSIL